MGATEAVTPVTTGVLVVTVEVVTEGLLTLGCVSVTDTVEVAVRGTDALARPTLPPRPTLAVIGNVDITTPPTGKMLACGFTTGGAVRAGSEAIKQLPTDATLGAGAEFATQTNVEVAGLSPTNTALGAGTGAISTDLTPMPTVVGTDVGPGTALTPTPAPTCLLYTSDAADE